jgi:hypothetical protein
MAWKSPRGGLTRFCFEPRQPQGKPSLPALRYRYRECSYRRYGRVHLSSTCRSSKLNLAKLSTKLNLVLLNLAKFIDSTWMLVRALESRCSTAVRLLVPYLRLRLCTRLCPIQPCTQLRARQALHEASAIFDIRVWLRSYTATFEQMLDTCELISEGAMSPYPHACIHTSSSSQTQLCTYEVQSQLVGLHVLYWLQSVTYTMGSESEHRIRYEHQLASLELYCVT